MELTLLFWLAVTFAADHDVEPCVMKGVVSVESSWDPYAVGAAGERGIAQLSRHEWERFGINAFDAEQSLHALAHILGEYHVKYGRWDTALAAYNAGEGAVARYGGPPPYTRGYLQMVRERGMAGRWRSECKDGWPE